MTNYEIDTRVPLIIRVPGMKNKSSKLNQLVEFVDIYPTLCKLAGLSVPKHLQGSSALPLFGNPTLPWKKAVFSQFLREGIWIAPDGVEYMGYAIRTERYRYVRWINWETKEFAAQELYDHQRDPGENVNIVDDPQFTELVQKLSAQLDAGWREALPGKWD